MQKAIIMKHVSKHTNFFFWNFVTGYVISISDILFYLFNCWEDISAKKWWTFYIILFHNDQIILFFRVNTLKKIFTVSVCDAFALNMILRTDANAENCMEFFEWNLFFVTEWKYTKICSDKKLIYFAYAVEGCPE